MPKSLTEPLPPRPPPFEEEAVGDVSVDQLSMGNIDLSQGFTLDRSVADEMVPVADPDIESRSVRPLPL